MRLRLNLPLSTVLKEALRGESRKMSGDESMNKASDIDKVVTLCTGMVPTNFRKFIVISGLGEHCDRPVIMSNPQTLFLGPIGFAIANRAFLPPCSSGRLVQPYYSNSCILACDANNLLMGLHDVYLEHFPWHCELVYGQANIVKIFTLRLVLGVLVGH